MIQKRLFDLFSACMLFSLLLPLMLLIGLFIKLTSHGPAIFWTERVGKAGVLFLMPKFRTMYTDAPITPTENLLNPERHITGIGRLLRKTSIDELPQLYSVIVGEMSLVGPRPLLKSQTDLLEDRRVAGVEDLRPGITGWAQINGRDNISKHEKIRLDQEYIARQSLMFDIKILWRTALYVLSARDVWH